MRRSHFTMGSMESGPQNPTGIQTSNLDLVGIKENSIMRWVLVFLPSMPHGELGTQPGGIGDERFSSVRLSFTKLCFSDGQAHAFCDLRKTLASPEKGSKPSFLSPSARAETITGKTPPTAGCFRWLRFGNELLVFLSLSSAPPR